MRYCSSPSAAQRRREEIRPFLARVTKGIPIPPERLEEVAHHYEAVGGKSPLNEITFHQAEALRQLLNAQGRPLPVYVGMRNSAPFFVDTVKQMASDGIQNALGFHPLVAPHRSELGALSEKYRRRPGGDRCRRARRSIIAMAGTTIRCSFKLGWN